jgi:hypothetical protein
MNKKNLKTQANNSASRLTIKNLPAEVVELSEEALSQIWGGVEVRNDADVRCTRWWVHFSPGAGEYPCEEVLAERGIFITRGD